MHRVSARWFRAFLMLLPAACFIGQTALCAPASPTPLVLTTFAGPPLSTPESDGFYDQVLLEAFRRIGVPCLISHLPAERSLINADKGITDGDFVRISGLERIYPNLVRVPEKIADFEFTAFTLHPGLHPAGWNDFTRLNAGIVRGWKILEKNLESAKSLVRVKNQGLLFSLLEKKRIDVAVYSRFEGLEMARRMGIENVRAVEPPLEVREMFLYLNRRHAPIVEPLARALLSMKQDGAFDRIAHQTVHVCVHEVVGHGEARHAAGRAETGEGKK